MRFTEESQERLLTWFTHSLATAEQIEVVAGFLADLEHNRWDRYRHQVLQGPSVSRRYLFFLPVRGLMAVVDCFPSDQGELILDLVSVFEDPDASSADPWGLP